MILLTNVKFIANTVPLYSTRNHVKVLMQDAMLFRVRSIYAVDCSKAQQNMAGSNFEFQNVLVIPAPYYSIY